ncbi:MAG: AbrB/MazE/SpoVT family DNA-binding domain-containing protein [Casimicrobiaceae bacterium]|nr:AbrB/MazE/SpoVT family DNA-binding domain-containing protein [Casimicrobiaceae bacterium]MCX8098140.1 AbrB/MazE/SpoVT family DNA-binding domain-containing protein [Casimicrobiaceae bacterium]
MARVFRNGRNQAVRIPRDFELSCREVLIRREGKRLVLEPLAKKGLLATLAELPAVEVEFPDVDQGLPALDDVPI